MTITPADRRLTGIRTVAARQAAIDRRVRGVGGAGGGRDRLARIPAYTGGRVEDLMVNYTGQKVAAGDELAKLYAPDLYAAQTELLTLKQTRGSAGGRSRLADVRDRMISGTGERAWLNWA